MKTHTEDGMLLSKYGRIIRELSKDIDKLNGNLIMGQIDSIEELIEVLSSLVEKTKKLNEVN